MNKDWNVKWSWETKSGTLIIRDCFTAEVAFAQAKPALMAICREQKLKAINISVEERKE